MDSIFILNETFTNGYRIEVLNLISIASIICGILVIISKNPIISVLFLIGLFLSISSYLILLGMNFIGLSYLLVYIGAISILFLFILMLINIRVSELQTENNNSIPLAFIIGVSSYYIVNKIIPSNYLKIENNDFLSSLFNTLDIETNMLLYSTSKSWDNNIIDISHIVSIGNVLYSNYFIWLVITSIVLLLAMVGSIIITIKQENK